MPNITDNSPPRQIVLTEDQISFIVCGLRDLSDAAYNRIKTGSEPEELDTELGLIKENRELAQFLESQMVSELSRPTEGNIDEDVPQEVEEYLTEGNDPQDLVKLLWNTMDAFERYALRAEIVHMSHELEKEG